MPELTAESITTNVSKFLNDTLDARTLSEKCRDYYDGKQYTSEEARKIEAKGMNPIVVNKTKPKVEGLVGLYDIRRSDPKAYPRTQKHGDAGELVTDALRFVTQNNDFDTIRTDVAENFFIEGYGGAIVDMEEKQGEKWVDIKRIPWDRIGFDTHSRQNDHSDDRWKFIILWKYRAEVMEQFPKLADSIQGQFDTLKNTDQTFEDKPDFGDQTHYIDKENDRIRMVLYFEKYKGEWQMALTVGYDFVIEPMTSPYLDDEGDPTCPIELVSAYIDRDKQRYSETKHILPLQDELNHRRTKYLHFLSQRQTFGTSGDTDIAKAVKRELAKANGHVQLPPGSEWGRTHGIIPSNDMSNAQFTLYQDSKSELAATSHQANLSEARGNQQLSGVAVARLQQSDTIEINRQYSRLKGWELRIYRQVLGRIKQHWNKEKWIRVVDDNDKLRWVGFNMPITTQELLEEKINDESEEYFVRRRAAEIYTNMIQDRDERLQETVEVRNPMPELDVDLILDQSFDVINMEEEQFRMLAQFGANAGIDLLDLLEISQIRGKDELIEKIEARRQAAAEQVGGAAQLEAQKTASEVELNQAKTADTVQSARQKNLENELLIASPTEVTSVAI